MARARLLARDPFPFVSCRIPYFCIYVLCEGDECERNGRQFTWWQRHHHSRRWPKPPPHHNVNGFLHSPSGECQSQDEHRAIRDSEQWRTFSYIVFFMVRALLVECVAVFKTSFVINFVVVCNVSYTRAPVHRLHSHFSLKYAMSHALDFAFTGPRLCQTKPKCKNNEEVNGGEGEGDGWWACESERSIFCMAKCTTTLNPNQFQWRMDVLTLGGETCTTAHSAHHVNICI